MASETSDIPKSVVLKSTKEDCLSCRLIGGTSLLLASGYVLYRGKQAKLRSTRVVSLVFASSLGYTGIARLLGILHLKQFDQATVFQPDNELLFILLNCVAFLSLVASVMLFEHGKIHNSYLPRETDTFEEIYKRN